MKEKKEQVNEKEKNIKNNSQKLNNENNVKKVKNKRLPVIIVIILLVIIIIGILILNLINSRGLAINTEKYLKLEQKLEDEAKKTFDEEYNLFEYSSKSWITVDKLVSNNVISKEDIGDCKGYVVINVDEFGEKSYKSYIKCSYKYVTKGYNSERSKKGKISEYGRNIYFYKKSDDKNKIISNDMKVEQSDLYGEYIGKYTCNKPLCTNERDLNADSNVVITHNDRYIIISDDLKISIYDYKENKKINTNIEYLGYDLSKDITDVKSKDKYYGIIIKTNDKNIFYSLEKNKILYETDASILIRSQEYIDRGYLILTNNDSSEELLDLKTLKIKPDSKITDSIYSYYDEKDKIPVIVQHDSVDLLDSNMNRVFNKFYYNNLLVDNDFYVYEQDSKEYKVFNRKTEKIDTKNTNYPILGLVKNYIVVNKNGMVTLTDYNNNIVKELFKLGNNRYDAFLSGYYDAHDDHPSGLYLVFSNSLNCFEYYYDETNKTVTKYDMEFCGGYGKPVLYLYPKKKTTVTVNFEKEENLTTTYPKFKNEWKVQANPNGDLYDENNKYYYGLYWEEKLNHKVDFNEGFYVTKDNAIEFLEEKLSYIGLNDREKNEFIMYWLPILEKNEKSLVYFELTEERDSYNKLIINPKPDSLLRVAIHVKKVDKKINIKEQKLEKFNRKGFTAVEWGGINY